MRGTQWNRQSWPRGVALFPGISGLTMACLLPATSNATSVTATTVTTTTGKTIASSSRCASVVTSTLHCERDHLRTGVRPQRKHDNDDDCDLRQHLRHATDLGMASPPIASSMSQHDVAMRAYLAACSPRDTRPIETGTNTTTDIRLTSIDRQQKYFLPPPDRTDWQKPVRTQRQQPTNGRSRVPQDE